MVRQDAEEVQIDVPDYLMRTLRYVSMQSGKQEMELFAKTGTVHLQEEVLYGDEIDSYFYNEHGEKTRLQGEKGVYRMQEQELRVSGNVRSLSPDDFAMVTEAATFDAAKRILKADVPVEGESQGKGIWMRGNSAESPIDTNIVYFRGDAKARYDDKKYGDTNVRGDFARLDRSKQKVVFNDNVVIVQKDLHVTSQLASIFYDSLDRTGNQLNYMQAEKDVVIRQSENRFSQSQMAEFFADSDTVVLTGFPSVFDGTDTITGDKLTLYRSSGVVEVNSANAAFLDTPQNLNSTRNPGKNANPDTLTAEDKELILDE